MTSDRDILRKQLETHPENDVIAAMLTDALAEDLDLDPSLTARWVERVRVLARTAKRMAAAAKAIAPGSPHRARLMDRIRDAVNLVHSTNFNLVVVDHPGPPAARADQHTAPHGWWYNWTVTVGADWIITQVLAMDCSAYAEAQRARRRRDRR